MIKRWFVFLAVMLAGFASVSPAREIQQWHTDNGVPVLFMQAQELPIVDIRIGFRAGSARDGDKAGISQLLNGLLVEGSGKLSAQDIALEFERVGAQLRHYAGRDFAQLSLRSLSATSKLDVVVDVFSRVIALPAFPQAALDRDRAAMIVELAQRKTRIESLLSTTFMKNLYAGHAYENAAIVSESSIQSIARQDLVQFHSTYYVVENASLAIVGDLSLEQARHYAEKVVAYLPSGKAAAKLPEPAPTQAKTIRLDFDTPQTQLRIGMPVITRLDADYYALMLGNHIFGGNGSNSRLMKKIREEQGLSYNVYSSLSPLQVAGPFEMGLQTSNHQVDAALDSLEQLLRDFIEKGPTRAELALAKKNITGGFALRLDSNRKLLNQLSVMGYYQLPLDFLDEYAKKIEEVTLEDVRRVFRDRIRPEQMIRVIVGPQS
jgi:zinc protease